MDRDRSETVVEIFERALNIPRDRRSTFLDDTCGSDCDLREEVASLLDAYEQGAGFLESLQDQIINPAIARIAEEATSSVSVGDVVAGYGIEAPIGRGGMGVVYRARDLTLGRVVALKFLAPHLAHVESARSRFMEEARTASALDHPNICTIFRVAETDDGEPFFAMALYEGETLKERLARGRLSLAASIDIALQVTRGIAAAHERGILHRDLKPANVAITATGLVKILDFGLAGVVNAGTASKATLKGTAAYMAPEQIRGEPVNASADLWAVGVMLYEMLAGRRPFEGESEAAFFDQILDHSPMSLGELCAEAPAPLLQLVEALLAKDPSARLDRAVDVMAILEQIGSQPAESRPASGASPSRMIASARLRKTWWGMMATAAAILGFVFWNRGDTPPADVQPSAAVPSIAVLPFAIRGGDHLMYLREGIVDLLSTRMDGLGELRSVDSHHLLSYVARRPRDRIDPDMGQEVTSFFGASYFILGSVVGVGEQLEISASLYDAAGRTELARARADVSEPQLLTGVDDLARQLVAGQVDDQDRRLASLAPLTTTSFPAVRAYLDGERELRAGRFTEARDSFRSAVQHDPTFGLAWYRLARAAGWIGPEALNEHAADQAVEHSGNLPDRAKRLVLAYHAFRNGHPADAERLYRQILARYPDDREVHLLLGEALFHNNPFYGRSTGEAREPFERALMYDPERREVMVHLMDLAARTGQREILHEITDRYLAAAVEKDELWHAYRALRAVSTDPAAAGAVVKDLVTAGPDALTATLIRVAPQLRDLLFAERLAEALANPAYEPGARALAHLTRAQLQMAQGRWGAADASFRAARAFAPGWSMIQQGLAASLPFSPVDDGERRALREAVMQWQRNTLSDGQHDGELPAVQQLLTGLLSVRLGDEDRASAAVRALRSKGESDMHRNAIRGSYAATIEAYLAWTRGARDLALAALDRAQLHLPFHIRERSPIYAQPLNRFLRAELLYGQGRYPEALAWFESLHDGNYHWGAPFLGPSLERQALIHERLGRKELAVQLLKRCLELLKEGDRDVSGLVTRVREALARLT